MPIKKEKAKATKVPGILQDGPSRFIVRARWTCPKTGKRKKREGVASSLAEAVLLQQRLIGAEPERPTRLRFSDYAERWLRDHSVDLAPSTQERYVHEIARITVSLGEHYVDAISEEDVRAWRDGLAKEVAATTVNAHHRTLRVVLEPLVRQGVLRRNPARDLETLREGRTKGPRGTALTPEQFERLVRATKELMAEPAPPGRRKALQPDVGRMILTLAWTGMRRGELLALRFEDDRGEELHITRALCKTTRTEKTTKTDDPRLVPVVEPLRQVLDEQRRWLVETQHEGLESGLVFPAAPAHALEGMRRRGLDGMCWYRSGSVLNHPLRLIVARAGLPRISLHSFRRTYEDLMRRAGVSDFVRRSLAGWRSEQAQAIYAGVSGEERAQASRRMLELVRKGGS